jgi:peptide/nickel transport system permease protein
MTDIIESKPPEAPTSVAEVAPAPGRRLGTGWVGYLLGRPDVILSGLVVFAFLVAAIAPGLLSHADPSLAVPADKLLAPGSAHWFGTDQIGRDQFSRMVHGAGPSLRAGLLTIAVSLGAGGLLGLLAGYAGRFANTLIMRICDAILAIPGVLFALAWIAAFGASATHIALAVGIASVPTIARVMRAEVLRIRVSVYVEAAHASGVRPAGVLFRHVLPNSWRPVLALAPLEFGQALLAIGALGYLGFSDSKGSPEWGSMIAQGQTYVVVAPWLLFIPALGLAAVVVAVTHFSRVWNGSHA